MTLPNELTTITPLSKYLAMFFFIVLPFVGFGLGVQYGKSSVIDTPSIYTTPQTFSALPSPAFTPGTQLYTSPDLGISFKYLVGSGASLQVKEIGDKVYVYPQGSDPLTGKYVEVFAKDANQSLTRAIQEKFLSNIPSQDCNVKMGAVLEPSNSHYQYATITAVDTTNKVQSCPPVYSARWNNGVDFFVMDPSHPTKYAFFSIGQDDISATYPTPGVTPTTWDNTITFN